MRSSAASCSPTCSAAWASSDRCCAHEALQHARRGGARRHRHLVAVREAACAQGVIALIETPEGVAYIEAIVAVPGLLGVLAGPFDLSVTMGLHGDTTHPRVREALDRVAQAASRRKLPLIMPLFQPAAADTRVQMEHWAQRGVRLFTVGTDKLLFADHCGRYVAALRSA